MVALIVTLLAVNIAALIFGEWVKWAVLAVALALIPVLALANRAVLSGLASELREWGPFAREQFLLLNEEWEDRVELARELGEEAPRVPIRGSEEVYTFHRGWLLLARGTGWLCVFFFLFGVIYAIADRSQLDAPWYDTAAFVLIFGGGGPLILWLAWFFLRSYVVDNDGIREVAPRVDRRIRWEDVEEVKRGSLGGVAVRSGTEKISISDSVEGYGRLVNIILSHAASNRASENATEAPESATEAPENPE